MGGVIVISSPTYVDSQNGPIFGVLSMPSDSRVRGSVVICPSLGKECGHATRGLKYLAEELAARGFAAFRFDYIGTGESVGPSTASHAVQLWSQSIRDAAAFVRDLTGSDPVIIGHRAGALLAMQDRELITRAPAIVLWDPVLRGRHFVRAQKAMYAVMSDQAGTDAGSTDVRDRPDDIVHLAGITLSADSAKALSRMVLDASAIKNCDAPTVLSLVTESAMTSEFVEAAREAGGVICEVGDQTDFLEAANAWYIALPNEVLTIADWLDEQLSTESTVVEFEATTRATVGYTDNGAPIETVIRICPDETVLWDTAIAGQHQTSDKVLVAHSIGHDIRTGPARVFIDLAMAAASGGGRTIRFDRPGVGEARSVRSEDRYLPLYSAAFVEQGLAVIGQIDVPAHARIVHTGICLGGWMAVHATIGTLRHPPAPGVTAGVVMVNPLRWQLKPADSTTSIERRYSARASNSAPVLDSSASGASLARRVKQTASHLVVKVTPQEMYKRIPPRAYALISRWALGRRPDALMRSVFRAGGSFSMILSPVDNAVFERLDGPGAIRRRGWNVPLRIAKAGDHAGFSAEIRSTIVDACLAALGVTEELPASRVTASQRGSGAERPPEPIRR